MDQPSTSSYEASGVKARGVSGEDMNIAQGLLAGNPLGNPSQESSDQQDPFIMNQQSENLPPDRGDRRLRYNATSNTWTSSSGEVSETDDIGDRTFYVKEFNKLAQQHGIPDLVPDGHETIEIDKVVITGKPGSWLMRKILKRTTSMLSTKQPKPELKHKRSISDISLRAVGVKRDSLKDRHLAELVRLCGSSPLYLPVEYSPGRLSLPTCFRATAQYLVQRGPAIKGIFRVSGSNTAVAALYDHYASQDEDGDVISDTVRCPTLPENIPCDEHDVASTFKRFLFGLPGGILGEVWLFEALVAIHDQMGAVPEEVKTRQSKVRARMIACAVAAHSSRFQRDLICAVFGLLCMIGRSSEVAVREDFYGRPLPTNELMGYGPLGMVFGPLLLGDLIDGCNPRRAEVSVEMSEGRASSKKKSRHRKPKSAEESLLETKLASAKLRVAGRVAEMLITHWRDVVRHMKDLSDTGSSLVQQHLQEGGKGKHTGLRPSKSEFVLRRPSDWDSADEDQSGRLKERSVSPTPPSRNQTNVHGDTGDLDTSFARRQHVQQINRQRSRPKAQPSRKLSGSKSVSVLTQQPLVLPPPREGRKEPSYALINCYCRPSRSKSKKTRETASGIPPTDEEDKNVPNGFLYVDLNKPIPPETHSMLRYMFYSNKFDNQRESIEEAEDEIQTPIKTQQTQGPKAEFALNDNITSSTTVKFPKDNITSATTAELSEDEQDEGSTESSEFTKDTEDKDDTMQTKKKQPIVKTGTPKVSKTSKTSRFALSNQQSDVEDDLPPRISRLPGYSPSEHLERRKLDQAAHIATRGSNEISAMSQQSDANSDLPPRVRRIPGQPPSEHLERMLSSNIPESVGKHAPAYKSTGSTFRSGESLMMSEVEAGSMRVSHEEDEASLASLAQVLRSETTDEFQSLDQSGNIDDTPSNGSTHKRTESEGAMPTKANNSVKRASFASQLEVDLSDPKRASVNSKLSKQSSTSSVNTLIGRFNIGDQDAGSSSSPSSMKAPTTVGGRYSIKFPATEPSTRAMNSSFKNEASQQNIHVDIASPKGLPLTKIPRPISASLFSTTHQAESQLSFQPLEPTRNYANERTWDDSNATPMPQLTSMSSDARPSNSANPAAIRPGLPAIAKAPITPAVGMGVHGGTSLLFERIADLQRQLEARTEEVDNLRKQLATKSKVSKMSKMNDYTPHADRIADRVERAEQKADMMQERAEAAEERLERVLKSNTSTFNEAMREDSANFEVDATRVAGVHQFPVAGNRPLAIVGQAQHGNVDGARSSGESTDTQGTTIMRTIPESRDLQDSPAEEPVVNYGTFGRIPRKSRGTSGEDLMTFSEAD